MSHKIYEVGDYSSSDSEEKELSDPDVSPVRRHVTGRPRGSRPRQVNELDSAGPPVTKRNAFTDDYQPDDSEDVVDMRRGRPHGGDVLPTVANMDTALIETSARVKPKEPEKKKKFGKGINKGESLTSEAAVAFMIKERQTLDDEFAGIRRENERLREELKIKQEPKVVEKLIVDPDTKKQLADMEKLKSENLELKKKKDAMEALLRSQAEAPPHTAPRQQATGKKTSSAKSKKESESSESDEGRNGQKSAQELAWEGARNKDKNKGKLGPVTKPAKGSDPQLPLTGKKYSSLPSLLWEGGKLWKIPYNGKGMPEERMIMVKRAIRPGVQARPVRVLSAGETRNDGAVSVPVAYIAYPPAIIWYNPDKPNEANFAREIVLVEGAYLVDGHQTPAFWKMVERRSPMPPKELCFSIVTSTRTLDLAAETLREANAWKNAIHMLLVMMTTSKEWGVQQLHRELPTWHHDSLLKDHGAKKPETAAPAQKSGVLKDQMFTATKLNNFTALDDILRSGVPVNLMDAETADTPLMLACRLNFPVIAKLCLDYGAKNDPHPDFGQTALHAAVAAGSYDCADVILDAAAPSGADASISNLPDPRGETPLHTAAMLGHNKICELLIAHGADMRKADAEGKNSIHLSAAGGRTKALATLLDQGGDEAIDARDAAGNTALHLSAEFGHMSCAKLLLETAANPTLRNGKGHTPYALASVRGHHQVAMLLLEYHNGVSPRAASANTLNYGPRSNIGPRAVSDSRAELEQERMRHNAFANVDERDEGGGAFTIDVSDQSSQPISDRTYLRRQHSYPSEGSLPRPHTASRSPVNAPLRSNQKVMSPLASMGSVRNSATLNSNQLFDLALSTSDYDNRGTVQSARSYSQSGSYQSADSAYSPMTARERPTPALFTGLSINKPNNSGASNNQSVERQYAGSPGGNTRNGEHDMAEYYKYVNQSEEFSNSYNNSRSQPGFMSPTRGLEAGNFGANQNMSSPNPNRGVRTPLQQNYYDDCNNSDQYSGFAEPLEVFDALGAHWQLFQTEEGYYYYLDQASGHSQWDDPRTHGWQTYNEQQSEQPEQNFASPIHPASPQLTRQGTADITSPNMSFKQPKAAPGKSKPVERVKHVRALKRAPQKIELDVTPTTLTPDTAGRPAARKLRSQKIDDEDSYSSESSFPEEHFGAVRRDIIGGIKQQKSLDDMKKSFNTTDDSDGYVDGNIPEVRLIERKRGSPSTSISVGGVRQQQVKDDKPDAEEQLESEKLAGNEALSKETDRESVPAARIRGNSGNEYFADVSGFVRRTLPPAGIDSDEDEAVGSAIPERDEVEIDIDAIPVLEDNLVVVPSPEKAERLTSPHRLEIPPAAISPSSSSVSGPMLKISPSTQDIKQIDTYWKQSSANPDKATPRSRARSAMLRSASRDEGNGNLFDTSSRPVYSDEDDVNDNFRAIIEGAKKDVSYEERHRKAENFVKEEWDEVKSDDMEGSDWDEGAPAEGPKFKVREIATPPAPESVTHSDAAVGTKNVKLLPIKHTPVLDDRQLLKERQFSSEEGGYGNGGNVYDLDKIKNRGTEQNDLQTYVDMLYTMSARSIQALMRSNGESESMIRDFAKTADAMDFTATSTVVNKGNVLKRVKPTDAAIPIVSRSVNSS